MRQVVAGAASEFRNIVSGVAGPLEKARAERFFDRVQIIPDNPSFRAMNLLETKKVGANDKIIFGTGDNLGIKTMTGDAKFALRIKNLVEVISSITWKDIAIIFDDIQKSITVNLPCDEAMKNTRIKLIYPMVLRNGQKRIKHYDLERLLCLSKFSFAVALT